MKFYSIYEIDELEVKNSNRLFINKDSAERFVKSQNSVRKKQFCLKEVEYTLSPEELMNCHIKSNVRKIKKTLGTFF